MNNEINYVSPFKQFVITIGNLPTAYLESMSYYEAITYLVNYLSNNVIPALNNNGLVVEEVQAKFVELKNYVDNYFENLDVQEEINNKLDEMAESGELTDIIAQYLGLAGMLTFNSVADMKNAQNLTNGSTCETLGYHSINDGGNAKYKVRQIINTDTIDEMFIIQLTNQNLIAELIIDEDIDVKKIGAYGDNTHDDTSIINAFITKLNKLIIPYGTYLINSTIEVNNIDEIYIKGVINYNSNNYALNIKNSTRKKFFINEIDSTNGGGIEIENLTFSEITINNFNVSKQCLYFDGSNSPITVNHFYGLRWYSETEDCIYMFLNSSSVENTFVTENNFHNMDFWAQTSGKRAIKTQNLTVSNEIQYNLYAVNLESTSGLKHIGLINEIGLYNCRTDEIVFKTGWLSFDGSIPNKMTILGNGALFPDKIEYLNTTYNLIYMDTNLTIQDNITNNQFRGGGILSKDIFRPKVFKNIIKSLTTDDFTKTTEDEIVTGSYELEFQNGCNFVNFFNISNVSDINNIEITIPYILANDIYEDGLIVHIPAGLTSLKINRKNGGSRTITSPQRGAYKFIPFFNGFLYIRIEDNY